MKHNVKAAAAGFLAFAAMLSLPLGAAEAGSGWRSHVERHGASYWVDKYVAEDKNGNVRYKGSKQDKWSGDYYNTKTGKWTGKQYDGEYGGKSSAKDSSKSSKPDTALAGSGKSPAKTSAAKTTSTKTYAAKPVDPATKPAKVLTKAPVEETEAPEAEALEATTTPSEVVPKKVRPQAKLAPVGELYGPPAPPEFTTASAAQ